MKIEKFKIYPDRGDVTLTSYVLDNSFDARSGVRRPGVLICPGGSYHYCSDREAEPVALRFAAMGYHAFILRYSVQSENDPSNENLDIKPYLRHPAPMLEIGMSFSLLNEHADEWMLDAKKIAVCGFSAGAHNCAMYAAYWNGALMRETIKIPNEALRPAAAILGYPLADFILLKESVLPQVWQAGASATSFLGGSPSLSEKELDEISPTRHINSDTPPCFIWATSEDGFVPVQQSLALANACADAKVPFELHIYEKGDHGLSLADVSTAENGGQVDAAASEWIMHARDFLARRFNFSIPEASE